MFYTAAPISVIKCKNVRCKIALRKAWKMNEEINSQKVSDVYKDRWEKIINFFKKQDENTAYSKYKHKTAWSVFLPCIIFASIIHFPTCTYCFILEHYFMQGIKGREEKMLEGTGSQWAWGKPWKVPASMRRCLWTGEHLLSTWILFSMTLSYIATWSCDFSWESPSHLPKQYFLLRLQKCNKTKYAFFMHSL